MKIVIATSGRAHLLDCARELENEGYDVIFYTYSPKKNFIKFGLKSGGKSLLYLLAPFEYLKRKFFNVWTWRLDNYILDFVVSRIMPKCDVFIAQSPYYTKCMKKAKSKFGAVVILDRGTSHVLTYNFILEKIGIKRQWQWYVEHDLKQYKLADYIAIASDFVKNSFVENGINKNKLFLNPYGVSLNCFKATKWTGEFDCICVGQWSKRKGSHLVVQAFENSNVRVLHVGAIVDVDFPSSKNFTHVDPVPESNLPEYYSKAKFFLFPSFEDGFGLVLCQAIACGLPIICSKNTGGPTLKRILNVGKEIAIMEAIDSNSIIKTYNSLKREIPDDCENRTYVNRNVIDRIMSWGAYGKRYADFLNQIF